jgi:hypothetical protein
MRRYRRRDPLARLGLEPRSAERKGAAKLDDQFLGSIAFVAPALAAEFAVRLPSRGGGRKT